MQSTATDAGELANVQSHRRDRILEMQLVAIASADDLGGCPPDPDPVLRPKPTRVDIPPDRVGRLLLNWRLS